MSKHQVFTPEEKTRFIELYQTGNYSPKDMIQFFPGRTAKQCRAFTLNNKITSGNRRPWSEEENQKIRELIATKKYNYNQMLKFLPNRTRSALFKQVAKLGLSNNDITSVKYSYNENYFDEVTLQNAYWGGFFAADGCVYRKKNQDVFYWSVAEKDKAHMELFCKQIESNYPLIERFMWGPQKTKKFKQIVFSTVRATKWKEKLKEHFGIIQHKTKRFPPPNLKNNKEKLAYLAGYLDGDGSIYIQKLKPENLTISIVSCNKELLIWISDFIESLNLPTLRNLGFPKIGVPKDENAYYFCISGFGAAVLYELIMRLNVIKLDRKWKAKNVLECINLLRQKPEWPNEIFIKNILNG